MNKLLKVIFAASAVVAASASAQTMTEYMAKKPYSGYLRPNATPSFAAALACAGIPATGPQLTLFQVATVL